MTPNYVRIISGSRKGLKIPVTDADGLRPTTDRARETIFNLIGDVAGFRVLDLFAGTGALGLEALSRGASKVVLVESSQEVYDALMAVLKRIGDVNAEAVKDEALGYLGRCSGTFDLVFLDPPYGSDLLGKSLRMLLERGLVNGSSLIYAECRSGQNLVAVGYQIEHQESLGQLRFYLLRKSPLAR